MNRSSVVTGLLILSTMGLAGLWLGAVRSGAVLDSDRDSLGALARRLADCEPSRPCKHLVYVRSDAMPLSVRGVPEIVEASRALGVPLTILPAHALFEPADETTLDALRMALVEAGATVHRRTGGQRVGRVQAGRDL